MQEKRHDCVVEMRLCFFSVKVGDYKVSLVALTMCRSTVFHSNGLLQVNYDNSSQPFPSQLIFFISFLCHIVIYAFILLDQLFIANGIHRIPIKTGIVISRYGDQISFPKIRKVLVLKISVELPANGIKSNAFCIP